MSQKYVGASPRRGDEGGQSKKAATFGEAASRVTVNGQVGVDKVCCCGRAVEDGSSHDSGGLVVGFD